MRPVDVVELSHIVCPQGQTRAIHISRCAGITGFLRAGTLAEAHNLALSAHCCPSLHVAPCCAIPRLSPLENFHDHVRIEHLLFEGALTPVNGALHPDRSCPGLGLEFKRGDAAPYAV